MTSQRTEPAMTRGHKFSSGLRCGLTAAILSLALPLLTGCSTNPATGGTTIGGMSERKEKTVGEEAHEQFIANNKLYEDPELNAYVTEIGQRMAAVGHRPALGYKFFVVDSPDINAFALPGGYVYVNRGLIAYLDSEDELAAVLGHEIGHITARHAVERRAPRLPGAYGLHCSGHGRRGGHRQQLHR